MPDTSARRTLHHSYARHCHAGAEEAFPQFIRPQQRPTDFRDEIPPRVKLMLFREQSIASAVETRLFRLLLVCVLLGLTLPSLSPTGTVNTPICNRDFAEADRLIHAIRLRENSVQQGDWAGLCRLLRQNHKDMSRARDLMNPCLTGHDHGENIGQIDASLGDIQYVLDTRCGRP